MYGTIFNEPQGKWMKGSAMSGLAPKWVGEEPAYVYRTRSVGLPEPGSPLLLEGERSSLVTGFLLGVVASYI